MNSIDINTATLLEVGLNHIEARIKRMRLDAHEQMRLEDALDAAHEFVLRAYLSDIPEPTRSEAVRDLIQNHNARTLQTIERCEAWLTGQPTVQE